MCIIINLLQEYQIFAIYKFSIKKDVKEIILRTFRDNDFLYQNNIFNENDYFFE